MTDPGGAQVGPVALRWTQVPVGTARRDAADELLRATVGELGGPGDTAVSRLCPVCGARSHGRPVVGAPFAVSVGYAGPLVVVAVARRADAASVGVDVEPAGRDVGDLAALFAPHPSPDLATWTRIEAVLKAAGRGVAFDPSAIEIDGDRTLSPPGFAVHAAPGPAGYLVSLAVAAVRAAR